MKPNERFSAIRDPGAASCGAHLAWICDRAAERGGVARSLSDIYPFVRSSCRIDFIAPVNASFEQLEADGATVHKDLSRYPRLRGIVWSAFSLVPAAKAILRLKPGVVVVDNTNGLRVMAALRHLGYSGFLVYRNHGAEYLQGRPRVARCLLKCCDVVVTVCPGEADILSALTNKQVVVVPNCIPQAALLRERSEPSTDGLNVGYVGEVTRDKGIFEFLDVLKRVGDAVPSARGTVRGTVLSSRYLGESVAALHDRITATNRCSLEGETPRSHVFDDLMFLAVCSRRESFGLTILEAPFYNVIPVAFDNVGPRFLLNSVAPELLVRCGDTSAMAARILMLWQSPVRRSFLLRQLRRSFRERFSPQSVATNFLSVMENHVNVHARSVETL